MKVQVTVTVTRVIEVKREYYPYNYTDEDILKDEIKFSDELFHEWLEGENITWEHSGKIIESTEQPSNAAAE